jgi:hypothetical protein
VADGDPGLVAVPSRRLDPVAPLYLVSWLDASDAFPAWTRPTPGVADDALQLVQSVGYLVEVADGILTLATSVTTSDGALVYGGGIHIPETLVRQRRRLS